MTGSISSMRLDEIEREIEEIGQRSERNRMEVEWKTVLKELYHLNFSYNFI